VPISHWTTVRFLALDVPLEFTQDESGSASFGISRDSPNEPRTGVDGSNFLD